MTDALPGSVAHASALSHAPRQPLLLCLSHLRWNFVFQRPQHLLTRAARDHEVVFLEEPVFRPGTGPLLELRRVPEGVTVAVPVLPEGLPEQAVIAAQRRLLDGLLATEGGRPLIAWFYTPMALDFAGHLAPDLTVYDCMDELSAFRGAPPRMLELERALLSRADLVFTGGRSLYEAKRGRHPRVHCFPSSIDAAHFAAARTGLPDPQDQAALPRPRIGFFGVVDERMDLGLVAALAAARPDWCFSMIGPVVKIHPDTLPRLPNIHWLGGKDYAALPAYLANWDAGFMPFARNESTRFISPTKTPEFLAAGLPVVSTPILDVVRDWGPREDGGPGLVEIADDPPRFAAALQAVLARPRGQWLRQVDRKLARISWDRTWAEMKGLMAARLTPARAPALGEAAAARIA
ncbi:glycosyltransferase [Paracraurococcus lichenis]|uniref:Glycosyltransferase n=1 Tax=Paracraurococcus lichenis TaxID=3064888 RepID=A0ABT9E449_9PROT|nr:glycosyltransferase [Paracraurococcus sp. LOR1-02]MDO9710775.1 glycosyltransferase [Paracraurococcus sp. LOR1-02]